MSPEKSNCWFPAEAYGWGWGLPVRWQGWLVLIGWSAVLITSIRNWVPRDALAHILFATAMALLLGLICYLKGEPSRWRRGGRP